MQADWNETDTAQDSFIRNKPAIPVSPGDIGAAPANHASQHQQGGSDPVTPILHAARHASGGADALSPADIGAASLSNSVVTASQARCLTQTKTASFTLGADDAEKLTLLSSASAIVVTLPLDATHDFPIGTAFSFIRWNTGAVTFAIEAGITWKAVNDVTSVSAYGCAATAIKVGANTWWLICG